jgi:glyceraldehyde-3-phosphate dehydrogenase (NAD(P))
MRKVSVIGYGTIGKRIADAIRLVNDIDLIGIGVRTANASIMRAHLKNIDIYCTDDSRRQDFVQTSIPLSGNLHDLLTKSDIVVDCTQSGYGKTRMSLYKKYGVKVIFQGGEKHDTTNFTYSTFGNFHEFPEQDFIRVGSCNTTGIVRLASALKEYGIEFMDTSIVRCTTDPDKANKGILNGVKPTFGVSHHGPDAQQVISDLSIYTQAVAVPMYNGHLQMHSITLTDAPDKYALVHKLSDYPRILINDGEYGKDSNQIANTMDDLGRLRGDRPEIIIWEDSIDLSNNKIHLISSIDMQSITIPETIDCIKKTINPSLDIEQCVSETDESLRLFGNKNYKFLKKESVV